MFAELAECCRQESEIPAVSANGYYHRRKTQLGNDFAEKLAN